MQLKVIILLFITTLAGDVYAAPNDDESKNMLDAAVAESSDDLKKAKEEYDNGNVKEEELSVEPLEDQEKSD